MHTDSTHWLDQLRKTLDVAPRFVHFFFRDDDAGWEDARLFKLIDIFAKYKVPIDLAVIPKSISRETAARLRRLVEDRTGQLGVHQHGYAHANHEPAGRKCEFGNSRSLALQHADIAAGKALLLDLFGPNADSIFTPPWNRCTAATATSLKKEGFKLLSRDITATLFDTRGLAELPVSVDWFGHRKQVRLTPGEIGDALSRAASARAPAGVMLHHALFNDEECERISELLQLLSSHPRARCGLMRSFARPLERTATP